MSNSPTVEAHEVRVLNQLSNLLKLAAACQYTKVPGMISSANFLLLRHCLYLQWYSVTICNLETSLNTGEYLCCGKMGYSANCAAEAICCFVRL